MRDQVIYIKQPRKEVNNVDAAVIQNIIGVLKKKTEDGEIQWKMVDKSTYVCELPDVTIRAQSCNIAIKHDTFHFDYIVIDKCDEYDYSFTKFLREHFEKIALAYLSQNLAETNGQNRKEKDGGERLLEMAGAHAEPDTVGTVENNIAHVSGSAAG